jgi:WD40 repeat protein
MKKYPFPLLGFSIITMAAVSVWSYCPDDVVSEIYKKIPFKDALRLRLVSKGWNELYRENYAHLSWAMNLSLVGKFTQSVNTRSVSFAPDGSLLTESINQVVSDTTIKTRKGNTDIVATQFDGHEAWCYAYSQDGKLLAVGSTNNKVDLWDLTSPTIKHVGVLNGHTDAVRTVAFSPDGKLLVSCSWDHYTRVWDIASRNCLHLIDGHCDWVLSAVFSPDGKRLATSSLDKTIKIWDPYTGECLKTLEGHVDWVNSVVFSPDGKILASASHDSTVKLWDLNSGQYLATFCEHNDWVKSVAFSPDGKLLVSGGMSKMAKIWDLATKKCIRTIRDHLSGASCVAFSPDGKQLVTLDYWNNTEILNVWA